MVYRVTAEKGGGFSSSKGSWTGLCAAGAQRGTRAAELWDSDGKLGTQHSHRGRWAVTHKGGSL